MAQVYGLGRDPKTFEFKCPDCGRIHRGSPSFAYQKPPLYFDVPEAEREARVLLSDDWCVIRPAAGDDETFYLIRCIVEIPIQGTDEPFLWGVWVTQSKNNFEKYVATLNEDQSGTVTFGWLPVVMPPYRRNQPGTHLENLKCDVHWQGLRDGRYQRPLLEVQESDHLLYADQQNGISWDRAIEIARAVMHPDRS